MQPSDETHREQHQSNSNPTSQHRPYLCRGHFRDKERGKRDLAYTSIHPIKATGTEIAYITNENKTINGVYMSTLMLAEPTAQEQAKISEPSEPTEQDAPKSSHIT